MEETIHLSQNSMLACQEYGKNQLKEIYLPISTSTGYHDMTKQKKRPIS